MVTEVRPQITLLPVEEYPPVAKALYDAKRLLARKDGWTQRSPARARSGAYPAFCAVAAISYSTSRRAIDGPSEGTVAYEAATLLAGVISAQKSGNGSYWGDGPDKVVVWNDKAGRGKRTILRAFDRAINKALALGV